MKQTLSTIAMLLALLQAGALKAQTIIPADKCGNAIATDEGVTHLSSSYCAEHGADGTTTNMFGVAWSTSTGAIKFAIGDEHRVLPAAPEITVPAGYSSISNPCMMIGSDGGNGSFLWVTVTYVAQSAAGTADLFMDIYPATNTYSGGLSYTSTFGEPVRNIPLTTSGNLSMIAQPRGDVINQIQAAGSASVYSEWFTLTWLENGTVHVMADNFRDVYSYQTSHMGMARYCTVTGAADLGYPDVAGIQRNMGSNLDRIALITYMDFSYNIYYQEWNFSAGEIGAPTIVVTNGKEPRIDAIDLYTLNDLSASIPHYNISYRDGNSAIYQYNDKTAASTQLITDLAYPNYMVTNAATVYGPGNTYTTAYCVMNGNDIYAQQMSGTTGMLLSPDYHVVNCSSEQTNTDPSISQLDNVAGVPGTVFICGYDNTHNTIWYKTAGDPLNFSTDGTESVGAVKNVAPGTWAISPNPASDMLNLEMDRRTVNDNFVITDVTGRMVSSGVIIGERAAIDVHHLDAGMYYLKVAGKALAFQKL